MGGESGKKPRGESEKKPRNHFLCIIDDVTVIEMNARLSSVLCLNTFRENDSNNTKFIAIAINKSGSKHTRKQDIINCNLPKTIHLFAAATERRVCIGCSV